MLVFHEIALLGCSCSAAIVCIFECLDWLGKGKFLINFINFFCIDFDQSFRFIKGLLSFYYFR